MEHSGETCTRSSVRAIFDLKWCQRWGEVYGQFEIPWALDIHKAYNRAQIPPRRLHYDKIVKHE